MAVQAHLYSEHLGLAMCGSQQDWLTTNSGIGIDDVLHFNLQEQPQQQHCTLPHHHQQGFQNLGINSYQEGASSIISSSNDFTSMAFSQSLVAWLEKQRQEIDWVLHLQNERLRTTLQEEARQQLAFLIQRYESRMMGLIWKKEEDLAIATKKTIELEEGLRRIAMENQTWQIKAKENESRMEDLSSTLAQVRERVTFLSSNEAQDAESFCDSSNRGSNALNCEPKEGQRKKKGCCCCKFCNARSSSVVFLPCRHLCSCKSCESSFGFCPVCKSVKEASIEVYFA